MNDIAREDGRKRPDDPKLPALISGGRIMAIVPQSFEEAWRIGNAVVLARMAPRGIDTPEQACVIILHGLEVGLTPMAALQSIAMINGRPCLYGDGLLGVVRASGLLEQIAETLEGGVATCLVKRRGEADPIVRRFSEADARTAGLWGKRTSKGEPTPWVTYPQRMLAMRARAFALRDAFADVLKGIAAREEVEDWNGGNGRPPEAREDGRNALMPAAQPAAPLKDDGPPAPPEPGEITGEVVVDGQPVGARILSDAELIAELEGGRDDGSRVEWSEDAPAIAREDGRERPDDSDDVFDVSTLLARVEHAYSECHDLNALHQVKHELVTPEVIASVFPPDRAVLTKIWQRHYNRIIAREDIAREDGRNRPDDRKRPDAGTK